MKKTGLVLLVAAFALGAVAPASAAPRHQATRGAHGANPYAGLLQSHRNGGEGLTNAVADLLANNPNAAAEIVALAGEANPDQKAAIALGLLRALSLLNTANPQGAQTIRSAMINLDPVTRAIFAALQAQTYAQNGGYGRGDTPFYPGGSGGFSSGGGGARISVSPN